MSPYGGKLESSQTWLSLSGGAATGQGCVTLTVSEDHLATNADLGHIFYATSASDYTLDNPTGSLYCGLCLLWMLDGAGIPTLDTKFRMMDGESIAKSSGRDLLAAIYNLADDQWDAFWKKGA